MSDWLCLKSMQSGSVCTWVLSGGGGSSAGLRLRWCSRPGCLWLGCFRWQGEGARGCWQVGAVICSITMPLLGPGGNNPAHTHTSLKKKRRSWNWNTMLTWWNTHYFLFLFNSSHAHHLCASVNWQAKCGFTQKLLFSTFLQLHTSSVKRR